MRAEQKKKLIDKIAKIEDQVLLDELLKLIEASSDDAQYELTEK